MNDRTNNGRPKPRHDVFVVENSTDNKGAGQAKWIRIGVAFLHKDQRGFNIELNSLPFNGKLVIREHEPESPS